MLNPVRKFILWMLIAALPLQAIAAAGMGACSPGHPEAAQGQATLPGHGAGGAPAAHEHESHGHADGGHHSHQAAMHLPAEGLQGDAALAPASDGQTDAAAKCSACSACCIGAALIPASVLQGPVDFDALPPHADAILAVSFVTDGPRRPPRAFSA